MSGLMGLKPKREPGTAIADGPQAILSNIIDQLEKQIDNLRAEIKERESLVDDKTKQLILYVDALIQLRAKS